MLESTVIKGVTLKQQKQGFPTFRKVFFLALMVVTIVTYGAWFCHEALGQLQTRPSTPTHKSNDIIQSLTEEERGWLSAHPVIRVAQDSGWPPVEFTDDQGASSGISNDYLKLIEQRLGIKFERVPTLSWQDSYTRLKRWEIDMTTCVATTQDRSEFWAFTKPYINMPIVILTQADVTYVANLSELTGKKIAVVDGYVSSEWIKKDFPDIQRVKVQTVKEGIELLQKGEVFAFVDNMLVIGYYLAKLKLVNLKIAGWTPYVNAQSMAVRKDWAILAGILQKALDSISESEGAGIYNKWVPLQYEHGFNYNLLWKALLAFAAIIAGLIIWNRKLSREIRYRKEAESALKKNEGFLNNIIENIPIMIFLKESCDLRFVKFNKAGEDLLGYSREDLLGKNDYDFFPPAQADFFTAKDRSVLTDGKLLDIPEEEIETKLKGKRILHTKKIPIIDADDPAQFLLGISEDITERKQFEESQKLLSTAIEQSAEAVIITDSNGTIQYINPAQEKLSGYSHDELIGQTPNVLKSDFHNDNFHKQLWDTIGFGKVWSGRFVNRKKDGTEYHEDATISPIFDKSGNLTNFVVVQHDVTKHIELQEQLIQAQKMEAIGTLAGGFAHDFNNKLQVIAGYVELMLFNKDLPENYKHDMGIIKQAVDSSAELIKGMMVFSRKTPIELQPIALNKLVEQTRSMLNRSIPKTIEIDLLLADDLWTIKAAPNQIDQILMNLAVNASDAMPDGGRLTIKTNNIVLDDEFCSAYPDTKPGRHALITVSDTGSGMDKETVSHIFEPFFTTKGPGKGTGLGLSVVYGIVEQHGARIICESKPSVGTIFKIYFPAVEEIQKEKYLEKKEPPRGQGETILLVDDEANILEMASRLFDNANYKVITASNAKDAIELYGKHRDKIRLVLLDMIMPEMGGIRCLEVLRTMDPNVKVLIITGYTESGMTQELKDAGAGDFILKPFDTPQLLEKIRKIIDEE
jgi:PAS domain S-box-containing protein